jgi:cysteine desulfurase family protein
VRERFIYLNNAATSYPKPEEVYQAVIDCMRNIGVSAGRGSGSRFAEAEKIVYEARTLVASFFGIKDASRVVFTYNATHALNLAIKGFLKGGEHVITTSVEHNAVWRPLKHLERTRGIEITVIQCDSDGKLKVSDVERHIRKGTKLIVMTHASNVIGTILPVEEMGELARRYGIPLLVDAAQTAGTMPIDVEEMNIDMLAFTGHKGLLGPQGIGGLYVREGIDLEPLIHGGTGSHSHLEEQPPAMPEKHEAGTLNLPAIAGLKAGVEFLMRHGVEKIREHEVALTQSLLQELKKIERVKVYGTMDARERVGVVSFNIDGVEPSEVAMMLEKGFGIIVRYGLHCAPMAHRTIGTFKTGTVRVSFGPFNTDEDVFELVRAIREICEVV